MFQDLGKRLIVSVVLIALVAVLLLYSQLWICKYIIVIAVAAFTAIAAYEYAALPSNEGHTALKPFLIAATLLSFAAFLSPFPMLPLAILFLMGVLAFIIHFTKVEGALHAVGCYLLPLYYLIFPMLLSVQLLYGSTQVAGSILVGYVLATTKMGDVCAYFVGKGIGRHYCAPELSPKKTWEGGLGGVLGSMATSCVFSLFLQPSFNIYEALGLGAVVGVFAILGDLAESLIKRDAGIKDSNTLPGLGGALDIVDSLLFTFPVVYLYFAVRI